MRLRNALLGACLALPLAAYGGSALAGQPDGARTITVAPGAVVLILPGADAMAAPAGMTVAALPAGDPMLQMVARQDAIMRGMMLHGMMLLHNITTGMNAAFARPVWPVQMDRTIRAAFGGLPVHGPAAGMVFTSMSGGPGVCSERVTYVYTVPGAKPQVTMSRSGDACGSLGAAAPRSVMQAVRAPRPAAPAAAQPRGPQLWTVSDPPQEIVTTGTPRS